MTNEQREAIEYLERQIRVCNENADICDENNFDEEATHLREESYMLHTVLSLIKEQEEEIDKVLELIFQYGQIDGAHHKMWVIDQIVRILTKEKYKEWVKEYMYDEDTGEYYSWDKGIAP